MYFIAENANVRGVASPSGKFASRNTAPMASWMLLIWIFWPQCQGLIKVILAVPPTVKPRRTRVRAFPCRKLWVRPLAVLQSHVGVLIAYHRFFRYPFRAKATSAGRRNITLLSSLYCITKSPVIPTAAASARSF